MCLFLMTGNLACDNQVTALKKEHVLDLDGTFESRMGFFLHLEGYTARKQGNGNFFYYKIPGEVGSGQVDWMI